MITYLGNSYFGARKDAIVSINQSSMASPLELEPRAISCYLKGNSTDCRIGWLHLSYLELAVAPDKQANKMVLTTRWWTLINLVSVIGQIKKCKGRLLVPAHWTCLLIKTRMRLKWILIN